MEVNEEELATLVLGIVARAEHGTVVTVRPNGAVETEPPGTRTPAYERREPLLATFVAGHRVPSRDEVVQRIKLGLRKVRRPGSP